MRLKLRAVFLGAFLVIAASWPVTPGAADHAQFERPSAPPPPPARSAVGDPAAPPMPPKDPVAQCLQDNLNGVRAAEGLHPLPEAPVLLEIAQRHSDLMASRQSLHHSTEAVLQFLPVGWRAYGENVVLGKTCRQMFDAFMQSDSHRAAMLRPDFSHSGTAVSQGSDGWIYTTLVFASLPQVAQPVPPPPSPAVIPQAPAPPAVPAPPAAGPAAVAPPGETPAPLPPTISLGPSPSEQAAGGPGGGRVLEDAPAALGSAFLDAYAENKKQRPAPKDHREPALVFSLSDDEAGPAAVDFADPYEEMNFDLEFVAAEFMEASPD